MAKSIFILDDHKILSEALEKLLTESKGYSVMYFHEVEDFMEALTSHFPDYIILDINLGDEKVNGIDVLTFLNKKNIHSRVIILTMFCEFELVEICRRMGAYAYLLKESTNEELLFVLGEENQEEFYLGEHARVKYAKIEEIDKENLRRLKITQREREIITLLSKDFSSKEMAELLSVSVYTIETHRRNLLRKLNVKSTQGIISYAFRNGILQ